MSNTEKLTQQMNTLARRSARLFVTIMCASPTQKRSPEYKEYVRRRTHLLGQIHHISNLISRANG